MAWLTCASALLMAACPSLVTFIFIITRHDGLLLASLFSGAFYLISTFIPLIIWGAVYPLSDTPAFHITIWVLCQEFFRMMFFGIYDSVSVKLRRLNPALAPPSSTKAMLAVGCAQGTSFALMHLTTSFLTENLQCFKYSHGDAIAPNCDAVPFITMSGYHTMLMSLCHISWSMIITTGLISNARWTFWFVFGTHMATAVGTLFNESYGDCCMCSAIIMTMITVLVVTISARSLKQIISNRAMYTATPDEATARRVPGEAPEHSRRSNLREVTEGSDADEHSAGVAPNKVANHD